ncbi:hypothetical protein CTAYLR_001896 [Chrysophaeum taylorii]|uniref:CobW C-terminal domain-containing protein n=1 Tax=Chrysophaeum taylorii TaxID=2483200 RepID=A0AAD7U8E2_9STRA|nr:hypothetical protein CTAYLR_001896 [Chrysophaeum taylorii]
MMSDDDDEEVPELVETAEIEEEEKKKKIPVTILCGFLGAGKSTIVAQLVAEASGRRIAVVTNEFGESGGLESVITAGGGATTWAAETVELRNGCVCCSVKDELATSIEGLAERTDPDAIIVELSGAANPGPVAESFWLDESLESAIELDAVVCVVDCAYPRSLEYYEARRQIAYADRLVLSKPDIAPDVGKIERRLQTMTSAETRRATRGAGLRGWLLATGCYGENAKREIRRVLDTPGAFGSGAVHETAFTTVSVFQEDRCVDLEKVRAFLASLLWGAAEAERSSSSSSSVEIFRVKGMVRAGACYYLVQGVGEVFEVTPMRPEDARSLDFPLGFLLFIGTNLDRNRLEKEFALCCHHHNNNK